MIGDPVDVIMLQSTGFELNDSEEVLNSSIKNHGINFKAKFKSKENLASLSASRLDLFKFEADYTHGVVKRFQFDSKLQRMSVLAMTHLEKKPKLMAFVKGSPEKIADLCIKESLPLDFERVLADYTQRGFRVIALAFKEMI
jgi:cation-transporting ATPase 13A3/4/5